MATASVKTETIVTLALTEDEFLLVRFLVGSNSGYDGEVSKVNAALYESIADVTTSSYRYVNNREYGTVTIDLSRCEFSG